MIGGLDLDRHLRAAKKKTNVEAVGGKVVGGGRNRTFFSSFPPLKCLIVQANQALLRHYSLTTLSLHLC